MDTLKLGNKMRIIDIAKPAPCKEGDVIRLKADAEEGWAEEVADVLEVDVARDVVTVQVRQKFRQGPRDDGLREVTLDQIGEVIREIR